MVVQSTRKRKADVLGRVADQSTTKAGRGAVSGWTTCPLCGRHSKKKYALGRGITAHLHAVHKPWNPGKVELKKRRRQRERELAEKRRKGDSGEDGVQERPLTWEPTEQEEDAWAQKVLEIATELERNISQNNKTLGSDFIQAGLDRTGHQVKTYRQSLPKFVQAAADGNLQELSRLINGAKDTEELRTLLTTRDRNGSNAEHWCAGEGHLECLKLLFAQRKRNLEEKGSDSNSTCQQRKIRRRDGKTCLHYAARNGRVDCIRFLLEEGLAVDEASGDGTTPLHMACYGGHLEVIRLLMEKGADILATNEWGCGSSHWLGMTKCDSKEKVVQLANLLSEKGVSFVTTQKQGHSTLHKAAQRLNRHVIEWMLESSGLSKEERKKTSLPDQGNHRPSELWKGAGGDEEFAKQIRTEFEDC